MKCTNRYDVLASTALSFTAPTCIYEIPTKSEHFHVPITLRGKHRSKEVTAMIDSGASTLFINKRFVKEHNVTTRKLKDSIPVYNIDGTPNQAGHITHVAVLGMRIGEHNKQAVFTVTDIGPEDVIIGIDWLQKHNPSIDWYEGLVVMDGCPDECHIKPVREKSNTKNE